MKDFNSMIAERIALLNNDNTNKIIDMISLAIKEERQRNNKVIKEQEQKIIELEANNEKLLKIINHTDPHKKYVRMMQVEVLNEMAVFCSSGHDAELLIRKANKILEM